MKHILLFLLLVSFSSNSQINKTKSSLPCLFIENLDVSTDFQCGKIRVPENHSKLNGKTIEIAYIIISALNQDPSAHPMVFLSGGPGGATLTEGRINNWRKSPLREKRDIILFDQRGIGHSSGLPNINTELKAIFAENLSVAEELSKMNDLIDQCVKKSSELGIELQYYNSFENAKDIGMLMKYLPYKKYNIYGASYGTRLARIVQEMYPDMLNSVILNSPNPIKGDLLIDRLKSYSLALTRVFDYCKNDNDCNSQFPKLKEQYLAVINSLKNKPLELEINGKPFFVNAQDGLYFLRRKLYGNNSRSEIPLLIKEYKNGGGPLLKNLIANEFGSGYNFLMWLAVERHEMYNPKNTVAEIDKVYKNLPLLPAKLGLFNSSYLAMKDLHNLTLSDTEKEFESSSVPTLITVNHFDPVTPPENGEILMKKLTKGKLFILDEGGHGGGDTSCRNKVMDAFMQDPYSHLDTACLNIYKN